MNSPYLTRWLRCTGGCIALAATCLLGCGSATTEVSGQVTFQGTPVSYGSVILYCQDKQIVRGIIGRDGRYSIPNVPLGQARVTVRLHPQLPPGDRQTQKLPPCEDGPIQPGSRLEGAPHIVRIPDRYGVPEESGLVVRVVSGKVIYNIELTP